MNLGKITLIYIKYKKRLDFSKEIC